MEIESVSEEEVRCRIEKEIESERGGWRAREGRGKERRVERKHMKEEIERLWETRRTEENRHKIKFFLVKIIVKAETFFLFSFFNRLSIQTSYNWKKVGERQILIEACRRFHQRFTRGVKKQMCFSLVTFLAKKALSYEKRACNMLMKLRPRVLNLFESNLFLFLQIVKRLNHSLTVIFSKMFENLDWVTHFK